MKRLMWAALGMGIIVGAVLYVKWRAALPVSAAMPAITTETAQAAGEPQTPEVTPASQGRREIETTALPSSVASERAPGRASEVDKSLVSEAVDTLVSPQAAYEQKQAAWKQLRAAGKLDPAIAELEQRMAGDPRSAEDAAALGQAYLQKCGTIQDVREQGILAMQADKVFDRALSLDPSNWEARFTKAVALSYWPASMNKGEEVIEHFQTLIQQQEMQTPQPQFAETYVWLGTQYEKAGRAEDARNTWERGAKLFPQNENLKNKLSVAQ